MKTHLPLWHLLWQLAWKFGKHVQPGADQVVAAEDKELDIGRDVGDKPGKLLDNPVELLAKVVAVVEADGKSLARLLEPPEVALPRQQRHNSAEEQQFGVRFAGEESICP
jgi:hypothetical protein